jgi:hypothetical protein
MDEHPHDPAHLTVDLSRPSAARVYDYLLGGGHNFDVDRVLAAQVLRQVPHAKHAAETNRAFLRRVVEYLIDHGIRQFLDLGSGIPTAGNVHEITARRDPRCTVIYVDNDPVAHAHSRRMLSSVPAAAAVLADLRHVDTVLADPTVRARIDFAQPVAVLMCAVLHFVPDSDDPAGIVGRYVDRLTTGSYVAISHATADAHPADLAAATDLYERGGIAGTARTHAQVTDLFAGLELLPPGVVATSLWRPEQLEDTDTASRCLSYAGLGITTANPSRPPRPLAPQPSRDVRCP